jgi:predicted nucleotidyltransferase
MQEEEIKVKKLFYVLRPLLAALWCAEKETIAPMSIFPLMDLLSDDLRRKVLSLIEMKSTAAEGYPIKIDQDLRKWIDATFDYCVEASAQMEREYFDIEDAGIFFRKTILK